VSLVFFSLRGFLMAKRLPKCHSFDSNYMRFDIFHEMEARIQEYRPVKKPKGVIFIWTTRGHIIQNAR
jgi:hypothetical protein